MLTKKQEEKLNINESDNNIDLKVSKTEKETNPLQDKSNKSDTTKDNLYINATLMPSWNIVLEKLKEVSHSVYTAFKDSKAYVSGQYVLIDSKSALAFELLKKSVQRDKIRSIIKEVTGVSYRLGPYRQGINSTSGSVSNEAYSHKGEDPLREFVSKAIDLGVDVTIEDE